MTHLRPSLGSGQVRSAFNPRIRDTPIDIRIWCNSTTLSCCTPDRRQSEVVRLFASIGTSIAATAIDSGCLVECDAACVSGKVHRLGDSRLDSNQAGSTVCVLTNCRLTTVLYIPLPLRMGYIVVSTERVPLDPQSSLMNLVTRDDR